MKLLGRPKNKWGWVRVSGWVALAGMLVWTLLVAALKGIGEVSWMAWSGYQTFSLLNGFELAITPLLAVIVAGWLEEEDSKIETEQSNHRENERAMAAQRREIIKRLHEAVLAVLPDAKDGAAEIPAQVGLRISEIVQATLAELDGKGKGEILHFLFEEKLLSGERPVVKLNGADFSGATIHNARLNGIDLEGVDLTNAQLNSAHLVKCQLSEANLSKAFLRNAVLREAGLTGSNLNGSHLEGANLEGSDLRDACLESAFLINTNLKNCMLNGLRARDAHLQKVDLQGSQGYSLETLDQAILIETIFPDGRKVTNSKGKEYLQSKELATLVDKL